VERPADPLRTGAQRVVQKPLTVDDEARVEPANPADAADHLSADLGHDLPKEALVTEPREDLLGIIDLAAIGGHEPAQLAGAERRLCGARLSSVEVHRGGR